MPLLSYEGVDVELPSNLTGIGFEVTAGTLTIHCCNFTGDVVLRQRNTGSSRAQQQTSTCANYSRKRSNDTSNQRDDADDGYKADNKRLRPRFLNEAEQTVLLAQLNGSPSSCSSQMMEKSVAAKGTTGGGVQTTKKTPMKSTKKKADKNALTYAVDSSMSLDLVPSITRKTARGSSMDRSDVRESQPEPSPIRSMKGRGTHVPMSKIPKGGVVCVFADGTKWKTIESVGNVPTERWGHTATKISDDRVVMYGGTDDEERTLGDLHVFDMKTHRWTTPLNCETIPRTWHDAVYLPSKNLVLVFGGECTKAGDGKLAVLSDIMVLDTECFLWFPPAIRGAPPSARSGHTCTAIGNEVVVFGGRTGRNRRSTVHMLDTDDWNWKAVQVEGKAPSGRTYHSAVAIDDDKIVYFGGNGSSKSFNEVHVLQKSMGKLASDPVWTWFQPCVVGAPPQERTGHSATLLHDGCIFIFGGWDPQRDDASAPTSVFNDSFILDTKSWEWRPAATCNSDDESTEVTSQGRVGHSAVMHSDGRVYFFGGQDSAEHRLKDICTATISQETVK